MHKLGPFIAFGILGIGAAYACFSLISDLESGPSTATAVYLLLGLALLIALGFEFVNGFHDTANAVATVIYTNSLPAHAAVIWSASSISSAFCCPRARSRSASSRCCRSSSSSRSAATPASRWSSRS